MGFDKDQFTDLIVRVITMQDLYSASALNLLLGTAATESAFGTYLRQLGGGSALGAFQMEPATGRDTWENYLFYGRTPRRQAIYRISGVRSPENNGALEWNIAYAICMARLHYRRIPEPFPLPDDVEGLAQYWKKYYNTPAGKGTVERYVRNYRKYVLTD